MSYENLKSFVGWSELSKDQFAEITGKNYDTGEAIPQATTQPQQ